MTTKDNYNCILCNNKSFDTKEDLQIHFRNHGDPNFSKRNKMNLQESPEDEGDNLDTISCDVCPKVFPDPASVLSHKRKFHPESYEKRFCSWCGKFFTMKLLFDRHLLNHDTSTKPGEIIHCDLCEIDFYNIPAMTYHNKFYHRQNFDLPEIGYSKKRKRVNNTLVKILFCPHCGEESINKVNLHKHINDNHKEDVSVDSTLRCPLCQAMFYSLDAYENHLTFHSTSDVYISKKKSYRSKLAEFSLETLPPKIERIDTEDDLNPIDSKIEKDMYLSMEEDQHNEPIVQHIQKKHKKHKKSKKSAITLDEFLNMNTDVFGEGLDFQGIEEVPTQVVAKQLKRKKPNVTTSLNIKKLKALGINIKKKPNGPQTSLLPNIKVKKDPPEKNKNISDSKFQKVSPTACNSMLTKLLNQSKDLKIVKKPELNMNKIKEAMARDTSNNKSDEKNDSSMEVSVAITHLSPSENDIVCKKELIDESEDPDSNPQEKTDVIQNKNKEGFDVNENNSVNSNIDDEQTLDFIKEEDISIEEEKFCMPNARIVIKKETNEPANGVHEEIHDDGAHKGNCEQQEILEQLIPDQNNRLKSNLLFNSEITIKPPRNKITTSVNTLDNIASSEIVKVTEVKIESISDSNNDDMSDSGEAPDFPKIKQDLQNIDSATKLLFNSQITLKSTNNSKMNNASNKQGGKNINVVNKFNKIDTLSSNNELTIRNSKSKEELNFTKKSEDDSDNHEDERSDLSDVDAYSVSDTSKFNIPKNIKQTTLEKNELHISTINPKIKLLANSQITLKPSSISKQKMCVRKEIKTFDDPSDIEVDRDCNISKQHSPKELRETTLDKIVKGNKLETSTSSKNKILCNSQITIKSSKNDQKPCGAKEKQNYNDDSEGSGSDTQKQGLAKKHKDTFFLQRNDEVVELETSTMSPKNKILLNSQITVKSSPKNILKMTDGKEEYTFDDDNDSSEIESNLRFKPQQKQNSESDCDDYDEIINKNMLRNKIMLKSNSTNNLIVKKEFDSDDEEFNDLDDDIDTKNTKQNVQQQNSYTMNEVKTFKEEKSLNTTSILNNTQLTVKQINTKSAVSKTMNLNNSELKMSMTSSVKEENKSVSITNQKNNVSNKNMTVKYSSVQNKVKINQPCNNTPINTLKNFKGIKIKEYRQSSSDDEVEYIGGSSDEEFINNKNTPTFPNNADAITNIQNKLGLGVTVKNIRDYEEYDDADETDDELNEPVQIGSIVNDKISIVNKLKTNNMGLSIKPLKQNINDNSSDLDQCETSISLRDDSPTSKIPLDQNTTKRDNTVLNNNKNLTVKPYKSIESNNQGMKNKSLGKVRNLNQNSTTEHSGQIIKQGTTSSSNEGETVTQAVTVKQFKTETVIEEITTTVTKTIRTVSQAVNEEHATTSTQKTLPNVKSQPFPPNFVSGKPVKISNQVQTFVKPTNIGQIRQAMPRAPRAAKPLQNITPGSSAVQSKPVLFRQPSPRGPRPVKMANSRMTRPTLSPHCTYKPVRIAANVNTAQIQRPNQRMPLGPAVRHTSAAQTFKASHVMKNVTGANTTKVMQRSMMTSSQMKSEYNSAGTSQQTAKVTMSSVNTKTVQKFEGNSNANNSTSLIEKLQLQGLLVKKPRMDVDFSDHSDDANEDTLDYDND